MDVGQPLNCQTSDFRTTLPAHPQRLMDVVSLARAKVFMGEELASGLVGVVPQGWSELCRVGSSKTFVIQGIIITAGAFLTTVTHSNLRSPVASGQMALAQTPAQALAPEV